MKTTCTALSFSLCLAFFNSSRGQSYHQLLFDTLTDAPPSELVYGAVPMSNGDEVLSIKNGTALRLTRVDDGGVAVWDHVYPGIALLPWLDSPVSNLFERPDGHILHAGLEDWECSCSFSAQDTVSYTFGFSSFGADGSLDWYRRVKTTYIGQPLPDLTGEFTSSVTMDDEGSLYAAVHDNDGSWLFVAKVDDGGHLVWSRHLSSILLTLSPSARPVYLAPDGQGGCYVVMGGSASVHETRVLRLASNGDVVWVKSFAYLNSIQNLEGSGARLASNGNLLVGAQLNVPDHGYGYLLRIDPTGTTFQAHLYEPFGRIEFAAGDPEDVVVRLDRNYVHLDDNGEVLDAVRSLTTSNDGFDQTFEPHALYWNGSVLSESGSLFSTDQLFGFTTKRPGIYAFGFDPASGCALAEAAISHLVVPEDYLSIADMIVQPEEHEVDTVTLVSEVLDHPSWSMFDACSLITASEEPAPTHEFTVANNPSHLGAPVAVSAPIPFTLNLYDSRGACVVANFRGQAMTRLFLPTADFPQGVYQLIARDDTGALLGVCKVIVQ